MLQYSLESIKAYRSREEVGDMKQKTFFQVSGLIFTTVAVLHLMRLLLGWEVVMGNYVIPMWASYLALPLAAYLAYSAYKLMR